MTREELFREAHLYAIKVARKMVCGDVWDRDREDICQIAAIAAWYAVRKSDGKDMDKIHVLRYAGLKARGLTYEAYYVRPNEHTERIGSNIKDEMFLPSSDEFFDAIPSDVRPDYSPIDDGLLECCHQSDREIIRMAYEQGLTDIEIGKRMGRSPRNIFHARQRSLRRIRTKVTA
jgi:hypothetical protein